MLGRSANGIYWMMRYLERAENTARLLDAGFRLALTRGQNAARDEWRSVLVTMGQAGAYSRIHPEFTGPAVTNFILGDRDNPGSVRAMFEGARSNARSVRTALTREVWEATNESWMVLHDQLARPVKAGNLGEVLAAIRRQATLVRGAMEGTMLRNEIFNFARLGTFIERADNTLRLLDARYEMAGDQAEAVTDGTAHAYYQWSALLRALSSFEAYTEIYRDAPGARQVAELLLLRADVPRSLRACSEEIDQILASLPGLNGRPAQRLAAEMDARLRFTAIDEILEEGLHAWLTDFIPLVRQLGDAIYSSYLEAA